MPRYDSIYRILARRAVREGGIDVESFVDQALEGGMDPERIQEQLLFDVENDGPIFGKFFRTLKGAAEGAVMAAERQGFAVGLINEDRADEEIARLRRLANMDDVLDGADPEELAAVEEAGADRLELTWVAELRNTCHLCLPLHGKSLTRDEWDKLGKNPSTIHSNEGWVTPCHCQLVPTRVASDREELRTPLVRNKLKSPKGLKGSKRTARGVTQQDLDRSLAARDKAMESEGGRRTLRLLGKSGTEGLQPGPFGSRQSEET
jgi:hypothetical protein